MIIVLEVKKRTWGGGGGGEEEGEEEKEGREEGVSLEERDKEGETNTVKVNKR